MLDTTIRKQTQITQTRHASSHKQLEVKTNKQHMLPPTNNWRQRRTEQSFLIVISELPIFMFVCCCFFFFILIDYPIGLCYSLYVLFIFENQKIFLRLNATQYEECLCCICIIIVSICLTLESNLCH